MTMPRAHKRIVCTGFENYDHVDLDASEVFFASALRKKICPCCAVSMLVFEHELPVDRTEPGKCQVRWLKVDICPSCGWWHYQQDLETRLEKMEYITQRGTWWELSHAVQSKIELGSNDLSIGLIQKRLLRRWDDRKLLSAQQAEDLIASLLAEHYSGDITRVTANANAADGGIDLYICSRSDGSIQRAVQVKRRISHDAEAVSDVRNFVGAMVLENIDQGVFVTTASRFTPQALGVRMKAQQSKCKLCIDMIDGRRLFEILSVDSAMRRINLPPQVKFDQKWHDSRGQSIAAFDLFTGDLSTWRS